MRFAFFDFVIILHLTNSVVKNWIFRSQLTIIAGSRSEYDPLTRKKSLLGFFFLRFKCQLSIIKKLQWSEKPT